MIAPARQPETPDPAPGTIEELLQFHDRLRRAMVYFFRRHRLNDPEELAGEVFLRVIGKISKGPLRRPLDRYCWRVARFVCLEQFRVRKFEELCAEIEPEPPGNAPLGLLDLEARVLIRESMELLSRPDFEFVQRYLYEDKQALARELDTSTGAMATRFCRLKKRLQELMKIDMNTRSLAGKKTQK